MIVPCLILSSVKISYPGRQIKKDFDMDPSNLCSLADQLEDSLSNDLGDRKYFAGHRSRMIETCAKVFSLCPPGSRVLDLGSHLLHVAILLSASGYRVEGIDVPYFSRSSLAIERLHKYCIKNHSCDDFSRGDFLAGDLGQFDLVLLLE